MCTSIVSNKKGRTLVGWNLDILGMEHKVVAEDNRVYIAVLDEKEGWMPLFGANGRGDFVAMPTCWPFDNRSDPISPSEPNVINLDIDLLLCKKDLQQIRGIAENQKICSVPGVSFMSQLSDREGNVLQIIPGQGSRYLTKPEYSVLTNFSPFKGDSESHPWMGLDRYNAAVRVIEESEDFTIERCWDALKAASQTVCSTVVSMVFDPEENTIEWCENRQWDRVHRKTLQPCN